MMTAGVLLIVLVGFLGLIGAGYLTAVRQARGAADLVALSGATAYQAGQDACAAARRIATTNKVTLTDCLVTGDTWDFVVTVSVRRPVRFDLPGLPTRVTAEARAGRLTTTEPAR
ncbi:MAG: flp pilus-assembly TadE/G-like family protein [Micropruina sp.]|nr:flp pilus-assembly TadE/G-like family protein [Micropruina sp.]